MEKQEVNYYEWSSPVGFFGGFIRIIGKDQFILKRGLTGKIKGVRLTVKDCSEYQKVQETVDLSTVSDTDLGNLLNELNRRKKEYQSQIELVNNEIAYRKNKDALSTTAIKNAKIMFPKRDDAGNIKRIDGRIEFETGILIYNESDENLTSYITALEAVDSELSNEAEKNQIKAFINLIKSEQENRTKRAELERNHQATSITYERTTNTIIGKAVHKLAVRGLPIKIIWPWELIMFIEGGIIDLDTKPIQFQTTLKNGVGVENVVLDVDYKISIVDIKKFTSKLQDNSGDIQKIYRFIGDKFDEILQSYIEANGSSIDSAINGENVTAIGFSENMINANRVAFERVCQDFGIELSEIKKKSFSHSPIKKDKAAMERQEIQNLLDQGFSQAQIVDMRRRNAVVNGNIGLGQQGATQNPAPVNPNPAPVNPNPAPVNPNPAPVNPTGPAPAQSDAEKISEYLANLSLTADSLTEAEINGPIGRQLAVSLGIPMPTVVEILKKLANPLAEYQAYLDSASFMIATSTDKKAAVIWLLKEKNVPDDKAEVIATKYCESKGYPTGGPTV